MSSQALYTAATGMIAQESSIDILSNNIANMGTYGFKKQYAEFQDLLYTDSSFIGRYPSSQSSTPVPGGTQIGHGVQLAAIGSVHTQGSLQKTDDSLGIAINGAGYLIVEMPNGERRYTRNGALSRNSVGQIVTSGGNVIAPEIVIPDDAISINITYDGEVQANIANQVEPIILGQIEIARFVNEDGLKRNGESLLEETISSGVPIISIPGEDGSGFIIQHYLESSNVEPISEMISLIRAQRTYEMLSKILQSISDNWKVSNNAVSS